MNCMKNNISGFLSYKEEWEEKMEIYPDPLYTMIMLGLCDQDGIKLSLNKFSITIEPPSLFQGIFRMINSENRNELVILKPSIINAVKWYPLKTYPEITVIFKRALTGLIHIWNTYSSDKDFVADGLEKYILLISKVLPEDSVPESFIKIQERLTSNLISIPVLKKLDPTEDLLRKKSLVYWKINIIKAISSSFLVMENAPTKKDKENSINSIKSWIKDCPEMFAKAVKETFEQINPIKHDSQETIPDN